MRVYLKHKKTTTKSEGVVCVDKATEQLFTFCISDNVLLKTTEFVMDTVARAEFASPSS